MKLEEAKSAIQIIESAGKICIKDFKNSIARKKLDNTIVTNTDILVDKFFYKEIKSVFPNELYVSEESPDNLKLVFRENCWLADPIDGTEPFDSGLPSWGICLSHFSSSKIDFGSFYNPLTNELYWSFFDGLTLSGSTNIKLQTMRHSKKDFSLCVNSDFHRCFPNTFTGKIRSFGSTGAHLAYVASGAITGCLFYNVSLWDIAAGYLILKKAGATIRYLDGDEIVLEDYLLDRNKKPALAAAPEVWSEIADQLRW